MSHLVIFLFCFNRQNLLHCLRHRYKMLSVISLSVSTAIFLGGPGLAGTRCLHSGFYWS